MIQQNSADRLLDITFASGFNSRSSFNRVFRHHTQMAPAEYRKRIVETEMSMADGQVRLCRKMDKVTILLDAASLPQVIFPLT